jgi:hypothetical protein
MKVFNILVLMPGQKRPEIVAVKSTTQIAAERAVLKQYPNSILFYQ